MSAVGVTRFIREGSVGRERIAIYWSKKLLGTVPNRIGMEKQPLDCKGLQLGGGR